MEQRKLPITCPLCGKKNEFPLATLQEGSILACPVCGVKLKLHGHMWEEIEAELKRLNEEKSG